MKKNTFLRLFLHKIRKALQFKHKVPEEDRIAIALGKWVGSGKWALGCSLGELAQEFGVTPSALSAYFRERFSKSFPQWRRDIRIEEAKKLLELDRKMPTELVGEAVGISDRSNFKRLFKAATGKTPSQWRSEHQLHI